MSTAPHPFAQPQTSAPSPFDRRHKRRHHRVAVWAGALVAMAALSFYVYGLRQETGVLILEQSQENIFIQVNGRAVSPTLRSEGLFLPLYAGTYRFEITKDGQLGYTADITTRAGEVTRLRPNYSLLANLPESLRSTTIEYLQPSNTQQSVFFLGDSGRRLFQYDIGSKQQIPLTDTPLSDVRNVQWNGKPTRALVTTGSGLFIQELDRYNFTSQIRRKVAGPEFTNAAWDPNEPDRLAAAYYSSRGEESLVLTDSLFENIRRIGSLSGISNPKIVWSPDSMYLALLPQSGPAEDHNIWITDLATNTSLAITSSGNVKDVSFNPASNALLYLVSEEGKLVRKFIPINGKNPQAVPGNSDLRVTAWKTATTFFEPNADGSKIILTNALSGDQTTAVNISNPSPIVSMYYYAKTNVLIFATRNNIYSVTIE